MFTVPLTRGSIRKLRCVIWPMVAATASMSALTKLSVTGSSAARAPNAANAKRRRNARLTAGIAPNQTYALAASAAAHDHVVRVHLEQLELADRFSDRGRARPAVLGDE